MHANKIGKKNEHKKKTRWMPLKMPNAQQQRLEHNLNEIRDVGHQTAWHCECVGHKNGNKNDVTAYCPPPALPARCLSRLFIKQKQPLKLTVPNASLPFGHVLLDMRLLQIHQLPVSRPPAGKHSPPASTETRLPLTSLNKQKRMFSHTFALSPVFFPGQTRNGTEVKLAFFLRRNQGYEKGCPSQR
jgi:hypothetical protein